MKKSFELEECFKSLNHIPRSETQKRKTYESILQQSFQKRQAFYISRWKGSLLTFVMLLFVSAFLYQQITATDKKQQASIVVVDEIADSEVLRTYIGRSDSDHYFSLYPYLTRKGVVIQDNQEWTDAIRHTLNEMKRVSYTPTLEDAYDMLIIFDGRSEAKCKLWISGDDVYIRHTKEDQTYKASPENALQIIKTITNIEKKVPY